MTIKRTAGKWDPNDDVISFSAGNIDRIVTASDYTENLLVAVNELSDSTSQHVKDMCAKGYRVFLDSGIFNLTNVHARKYNVRMDDALALAPDEIEGFDSLFERYLGLVDELGDKVWGYIELDQGGRENKIKTRARLESMGYRPIPVYHPLNDGWDYFDHLAENYDRICFGNLVQASAEVRKRLLATAWERRRKYPHLWIHLLGMSVNENLCSYPVNSCDSSSWLSIIRWATSATEKAGLKRFSNFGQELFYRYGSDTYGADGHEKAVQLAAESAHANTINWRAMLAEYEAHGFNVRGFDEG